MRMSTPEYVKILAKELRNTQTGAEKILWENLRGKKLKGYKFYRQCPIGRYIADFYCSEINLVIELDGRIHELKCQKEYDEIRQKEIEGRDIKVIRFTNEQVINHLESVIEGICDYIKIYESEKKTLY